MRNKYRFSLLAIVIAAAIAGCNESTEQRQSEQGKDSVNRTDTRRYTTGTENTIPDTATLNVDTTGQLPQ